MKFFKKEIDSKFTSRSDAKNLEGFEEFALFFSRCPICSHVNEISYLKEFYTSKESNKQK